jgi:hypothetical protein
MAKIFGFGERDVKRISGAVTRVETTPPNTRMYRTQSRSSAVPGVWQVTAINEAAGTLTAKRLNSDGTLDSEVATFDLYTGD